MRHWGSTSLYWASLIVGLLLVSFLLFQLLPSDPARLILGPNAPAESVAALRTKLGLDRPLIQQFGQYLWGAARLEFGESLVYGRPARHIVFEKLTLTLSLAILAITISVVATYGLCFLSVYSPRVGKGLRIAVRAAVMIPAFLFAVLLATVLAYVVPGIPLSGASLSSGGVLALLPPAIVAAIFPTAVTTSLTIERAQSIMNSSYFKAARSYGFAGSILFHRFIIRNSAGVWITSYLNTLGGLLFSLVVLENIFSITGISPLLIESIQQKDLPLLQGILVVNGVLFIAVNIVGNAFVRRIDPRMVVSDSRT